MKFPDPKRPAPRAGAPDSLSCNHTAASELMAAIILMGFVAAAFGVIAVMILSQPPPQKIPSLSALVTNQSCTITIYHDGGDSVERQSLQILVDNVNRTADFTMRNKPAGWTTWETGDTLIYTPSVPCAPPIQVDIVYDRSNVLLSKVFSSSAAAPFTHTITASAGTGGTITPSGAVGVADGGSRSFTIAANYGYQITDVIVDGESKGALSTYTFTTVIVNHTISVTFESSTPTITGITPSAGVNTTSISITNLAGTKFQSGAKVNLTRSGYPNITASGVAVVSPAKITCTFDLTGRTAGSWTVVVTNPDGQYALLADGFTITAPAPTVTSITPATGLNSTTISITNLSGTGYLSGAAVKLNRTGYADIAGTGVTVVSPVNITCTFDLTGRTAGPWNVVVTNYDGQSGVRANGFTITAPAPTVTSITPATGLNTTTISITNLSGTNFLSGATVRLNRTGYADIAGTGVTVVSPVNITCTFDLTGRTAGPWNVVVTNYDGQSGVLANGFTITAPRRQIYYEGFESGTGGWTFTGDNSRRTDAVPKNQTASIRLRQTGAMTRTISTTGYGDIIVQFNWTPQSLDSAAEYVQGQYTTNGGTSWTNISVITGPTGSPTVLSVVTSPVLPSAAGDNANFGLRFRIVGSATNDLLYVDDVQVTGIPV